MALRNKSLCAEWRNLTKHRMVLVSLIVMLFIPIMYGGFFLGSIWDPYGNTKHLPVAVVNEDQGAEIDGKQLNIGKDFVTNLKDNTDMGWQFVSADEAKVGINSGKYYMALTIPKDFSKNAATVTSERPVKSMLSYTLTPAKNYVASLLTNQAAQQISQTISTNISKTYVATILQAVSKLDDGLSEAATGASQLATGSQSLQSGVLKYTSGVGQLKSGQTSLTSGLTNLSSGALALQNGLATLDKSLPSDSDLQQLKDGVSSVQTGVNQLNYAIQTPDTTITQRQTAVNDAAIALHQQLVNYSTIATNASASIQALAAAAQSGQNTITVSTTDVAAVLQVMNASQAVAAKVATLLTTLNDLSAALAAQQETLAANVNTLNNGINILAPNLVSALNGYKSISQGSNELLAGATQLYGGSTSALTGSQQLLAGTTTLARSSLALKGGATQLVTGSQALAASLGNAADQLALQPTGDATASQIVTPVAINETVNGDVPNYGYALSPYVLSLGLFVGALVFNVIYPIRRYFEKPKNALGWWATKMSVAFAVAVCQAFVLDSIMVFGLGLHPDNLGQFVLISVVTSLTYMSIITWLTLMLDNIGRFLAMLLLVLQLGSAGGVFPIVLSSTFFQAVNPFVPMTYSIYAYREAISSGVGGDVYWRNLSILITIIVVVNVAIIIFFKVHGMRHFHHESIDDGR